VHEIVPVDPQKVEVRVAVNEHLLLGSRGEGNELFLGRVVARVVDPPIVIPFVEAPTDLDGHRLILELPEGSQGFPQTASGSPGQLRASRPSRARTRGTGPASFSLEATRKLPKTISTS